MMEKKNEGMKLFREGVGRRDRGGQSAIEFTMIVAAMLFFIVVLTGLFQMRVGQKTQENRGFELQELALVAQNEIQIAADATDGYSRRFTMPQTLLGIEYSILIEEGWMYLNTSDGKHALSLTVQNVTGQFTKGENVIRKIDGEILLN